MKHLIILILFPTLLIAQADKKLNVGVILPLSGPVAELGNSCRKSMELAYLDLSDEVKSKLDLKFEDDRNSPTQTIGIYKRLLSSKKINSVFTYSSPTSFVAKDLSEKNEVTQLSIASDPNICKNTEHVFNFWITPEAESKLLVKELKKRDIKKIALVYTNHDGVESVLNEFRKVKGDIKIIFEEGFNPDEQDFKSSISKLKQIQENVDGIFLAQFFGKNGLYARQARQLGINLPFFNIESFENDEDLKIANGALEGGWYIQGSSGNKEFLNKFNTKYPNSSTYAVGNCYDVVKLYSDFIERSEYDDLSTYLSNIKDFKGVLGTYSSTKDNRFTLPGVVKVIRGNKFVIE